MFCCTFRKSIHSPFWRSRYEIWNAVWRRDLYGCFRLAGMCYWVTQQRQTGQRILILTERTVNREMSVSPDISHTSDTFTEDMTVCVCLLAFYLMCFVEEQGEVGENHPEFLPAITVFKLSEQISWELVLSDTVKMMTKLLQHFHTQTQRWADGGLVPLCDAEVQHGNTGVAMPAHMCCRVAAVKSVSWIVAISRQRCSRSRKIILWLHFRRPWPFWEKHLLYLETHNCAKACYCIVSNCYRITGTFANIFWLL